MKKIKILPNDLINKISSGPLILKPYYVVKELIENSLDANSNLISIYLEDGGKKKIIIRDNGDGIYKNDLILTVQSHATSKITSYEDFKNLITLGFRGEALSSISSISRFKIISKPKKQKLAWILFKNSFYNKFYINPYSHPLGTTVEIENLFYNIGIKRYLLNSSNKEFKLIHNLIKQFSILYNNITFEIIHNNNIIKLYKKNGNKISKNFLKSKIIDIFGNNYFSKLISIHLNYKNIHINGWISSFYYSDKKKYNIQYCYINNRIIFSNKIINHAINQAYYIHFKNIKKILPSYIIKLNINNNDIDINIHPSKTKIKFKNINKIHNLIYNLCLVTLNNFFKKKIYKVDYKLKTKFITKKFQLNKTLINIDINFFKIKKFFYSINNIYNNKQYYNKNFFGKILTIINKKFLLTKFNNNKLLLINLSKGEIYLKKIQLFPIKKNLDIYLIYPINIYIYNLNKKNFLKKNLMKLTFFKWNINIINNILFINKIPLGLKYQNIKKIILKLINYLTINLNVTIINLYDWFIINTINKYDIWTNISSNKLIKEFNFLSPILLKKIFKYFCYDIDNEKFIKDYTKN